MYFFIQVRFSIIWETSLKFKMIWSCICSGHTLLKKKKKPILCCIYRPLVPFIECLPSDRPHGEGWIPMSSTEESRSMCFPTHTFSTTNMTIWGGGSGGRKLSLFFLFSTQSQSDLFKTWISSCHCLTF